MEDFSPREKFIASILIFFHSAIFSYVFIFNPETLANPATTSKLLCVSECPDIALQDINDIIELARNRSIFLCDYSLEIDEYASAGQGARAACPVTPVDAR